MKPLDFVIVGVGGQGILLASDVICQVGVASGYDVKKTDVHGMAQRGGSVVSHVRMAESVHSPVVATGAANYLLAFEKLEACRWVGFLRCDGVAVVNDEKIPTLALVGSPAGYPDDDTIAHILATHAAQVSMVPAAAVAAQLGNARVANVVLLGNLSRYLEIPVDTWRQAISARVPARFQELNLRAFELGREAAAGDWA
ncbi:MAG: indolepyruvate oxidoreductase subunit beta [Anaerolineae bacterium]